MKNNKADFAIIIIFWECLIHMYLKLIANSLNQFLVDSYFGPGDLEMGTVVREDYDLVTPREFVWTYHSLLIKEITHMYIYKG